jgi:hypothetical protein
MLNPYKFFKNDQVEKLATVADIQWKPVIPSTHNTKERDATNLGQIYEKKCAEIRDNPNTQMQYAQMVIEVNFMNLLIIKNYREIIK